jgi:hypothetical protein
MKGAQRLSCPLQGRAASSTPSVQGALVSWVLMAVSGPLQQERALTPASLSEAFVGASLSADGPLLLPGVVFPGGELRNVSVSLSRASELHPISHGNVCLLESCAARSILEAARRVGVLGGETP